MKQKTITRAQLIHKAGKYYYATSSAPNAEILTSEYNSPAAAYLALTETTTLHHQVKPQETRTA